MLVKPGAMIDNLPQSTVCYSVELMLNMYVIHVRLKNNTEAVLEFRILQQSAGAREVAFLKDQGFSGTNSSLTPMKEIKLSSLKDRLLENLLIRILKINHIGVK